MKKKTSKDVENATGLKDIFLDIDCSKIILQDLYLR